MSWKPVSTVAPSVLIAALLAAGLQTADAHQGHRDRATPAALEAEVEPVAPEPTASGEDAPGPATSGTESADPSEPKLTLFGWLGRLHPLSVHFPIALLLSAVASEFLGAASGRDVFQHSARFAVWTGALGAFVAAPLGWLFSETTIAGDDWLMAAHRWAGTAVAVWALPTLLLCERTHRGIGSVPAFRTALIIGAALVGAAGFLGGSLVYGIDHLEW